MSDTEKSALIVRQQSPFNGGPALGALVNNPITPNDLFFVRNHGEVPQVDPAGYRLLVDGLVEQPLTLSLDEIRGRFPARTVTATLECAGNRRSEFSAVEPIAHELNWGPEAIGTAEWRGASLQAVLRAAGLREDGHVAFVGLDETERQNRPTAFGGSVPLGKALQDEVLLAYEMNGRPLPPIHGFPLRVVVPGYIGARSVKWLTRLTVQAAPSANYFQAVAYRLFAPDERPGHVNVSTGLMLAEAPVNAVICRPCDGERFPAGSHRLTGYAFTGGGRRVARVDVSADGGGHWQAAELEPADSPWAWQLWWAQISLASGGHQLVVRAVDSSANSMPEALRTIWNFKGYVNNAWHRVNVYAE